MIILSILAFILIFSTLILVHEWGHFTAAIRTGVKVEEFGLGLGHTLLKKHHNGVDFTLNAIPFGGFVRMLGEEESSNDPRSFEQAALWKRMLITVAGVIMNWLFAIIALIIVFWAGSTPILITQSDFQSAIDTGIITVDDTQTITAVNEIQKPLLEAIPYGITETFRISGAVLQKVAEIPGDVMRQGGVPEGLAGPVGIAQITHQVTPEGLIPLLKLAALLSISLAVMNLLPIPALDGGRLLFQLFELITGQRPPAHYENYLHYAGFVLLMSLLLLVTWSDIARLIAG